MSDLKNQTKTPATEINMTVNGQAVSAPTEGSRRLLDYLRRELNLTGAKEGCGQGQCGACTVLLDGAPVRSCTVRMNNPKLDGAVIETIESLARGDMLHPIQEAFVRAGALQCGFCTPGMIMSVKGLLDFNPDPDRAEIKQWLTDQANLCRCTGYQKIFQAVEEAARMLRGEPARLDQAPDNASLRRRDAALKVTGRLKYANDIVPPGLLHGKVLFSAQPHARLTGLDLSAAERMDGVAAIVTRSDITGTNLMGIVERDQPGIIGIGDEIRSVSDVLAAVFAETPDQAEAAVKAIKADYETLPGVFSYEEARAEGAPLVHADKPGNVFYHNRLLRGDVEAAFDRAAAVFSSPFSTSRAEHGFMEPESGLARPDDDGGVTVFYPSQTVFDDQAQLAEILGLPRNKVRVKQLPTGGAFGGKEDIIFHHLLALGALKTGRPVRITLTRRESLRVKQKKHGVAFDLRLALDDDGRFTALRCRATADGGAYANLSLDIMENVMDFVGGPYFIPAVDIEVECAYSHNVQSGAMRGFGANQANFAIESLIDEAARKSGRDPIELRRINALRPGLPTVSDHVLEPGLPGIVDCLDKAAEALTGIEPPVPEDGWELGFGLACGVKNIGFGHGLPESAGARIELDATGRCRLCISQHEYGQGAIIGQARIVSETLGIPVEEIEIDYPDTARTPFTGPTTASRQTFLTGAAVLAAAQKLKGDLLARGAIALGLKEPASLRLKDDRLVSLTGDKSIALKDLGDNFTAEHRQIQPDTDGFRSLGEKSDYGQPGFRSRRTHWCYTYGVQGAWVQVNRATGQVRCLKVVSVSDVGRALNPRAVEGQQEGGVVMGVGYALSEQVLEKDGITLTNSLRQAGLPRPEDAPEIIALAVETPHPWGPLGVKGLAEGPSLATAPAVANAIRDAVGLRMIDLPITPEKIKAALAAKGDR